VRNATWVDLHHVAHFLGSHDPRKKISTTNRLCSPTLYVFRLALYVGGETYLRQASGGWLVDDPLIETGLTELFIS